jgi:hypothetical protein
VYSAPLPPVVNAGDPWRNTRLVLGVVLLAAAAVIAVPHILAGGMSNNQLLPLPLQHFAFALGGLLGLAGFVALIWR